MTETKRTVVDGVARQMQDMIRKSRENNAAIRARHPEVWSAMVAMQIAGASGWIPRA